MMKTFVSDVFVAISKRCVTHSFYGKSSAVLSFVTIRSDSCLLYYCQLLILKFFFDYLGFKVLSDFFFIILTFMTEQFA